MLRSFAPPALAGVRPLGLIASGGGHAAPGEVMRRLSPGDIVLEEYRPVPLNLEWRLSDLYWATEGVRPFITDTVPYSGNNDGRASAAAAEVLFANCVEAAAEHDPIRVLEVGAGTALFARYLLDEFKALCLRHGRDFYDRLQFHVTDRSPQSVQHWRACDLFGEHAARVRPAVCDAAAAALAPGEPLRAVFANYVVDSLPAAVVRRTGDTWQQLCVRATIREDVVKLLGSGHRVDRMRQAARSDRTDDLVELLPLLPYLDTELAFLDLPAEGQPGWAAIHAIDDAAEGAAVIDHYGALRWFESLLPRLDATGFVLIRDYGFSANSEPRHSPGPHRFGGATAVPVDFVRLERQLRARSVEVVGPDREGLLLTRLMFVGGLARTPGTFLAHFATAPPEPWELLARARQYGEQGLLREALDIYQHSLESSPRDWRLLGEAACFAATQLRNPEAGLELARAAVQLNPWYSPFLWNVLGDCLAALDRHEEAHASYVRARDVHPGSVESHLRLAKSWLRLGDVSRSLESIAHGLASDVDDMYRRHFLEAQQEAIDALSRRQVAQREAAFRRRARGDLLASGSRE
jgi:tetratricopeptide (TPR) repeat protein